MNSRATSVAAGIAIGALAWIDPIFIPLVLAGPIISGAICAARGVPFRLVAIAWAVGGAVMLITDAIVNQEDIGFHAVLTVIMVGLAALGWAPVRAITNRRTGAMA